jgi:hypothetical protein
MSCACRGSGASYNSDPKVAPASRSVRNDDPAHPATRHLPKSFALNDEIYQFRDWSRSDVRVLLSLDENPWHKAGCSIRRWALGAN